MKPGRGCPGKSGNCRSSDPAKGVFKRTPNDSKQLSKAQREYLREEIEDVAISYFVVHVSPEEIDQINILNAPFPGNAPVH